MAEPNVTLTITLSTAEALDFAALLHRLDAKQLLRFSWRSLGDTEVTIANWGDVLTRLKDELARRGYPGVRT
jgi:hypothetical protein